MRNAVNRNQGKQISGGQVSVAGSREWVKQHGKRIGSMKSNGEVPPHPYYGYRTENGGQGGGAPNVKVA